MIANKATTVSADKTVAEIQKMLASVNATSMMIDYDQGRPDAVSFKIVRNDRPISFRLPSNWQGLLAAMKKDRTVPRRLCNED